MIQALQHYAGLHDKASAIAMMKQVSGAERVGQIQEAYFPAVFAALTQPAA